MLYLMAFGVGVLVGVVLNRIWGGETSVESTPCPHGWDDWSDCPDCGH